MQTADWAPLAQIILGYAIQWVRAPKHIPNWLSYAILALGTLALYAWATPDFDKALTDWPTFAASWRGLVGGAISFFLASRGAAAMSKDTGAAKPTNSL